MWAFAYRESEYEVIFGEGFFNLGKGIVKICMFPVHLVNYDYSWEFSVFAVLPDLFSSDLDTATDINKDECAFCSADTFECFADKIEETWSVKKVYFGVLVNNRNNREVY